MTMQQFQAVQQVIRDHYRLNRLPSGEETGAELANLYRCKLAMTLDSKQELLSARIAKFIDLDHEYHPCNKS